MDAFSVIAAIGGLANLFGGVFGGLQGDQYRQWAQGLGTQALNQLTANLGTGHEIWNNYAPQTGAHGMFNLENFMSQMWGPEGLFSQTRAGLGNDQSALLNYFMQNQIPGTQQGVQDANQGIRQLLESMGGMTGLAGQLFAGGGWTPQGQQGFDQINQFLTQTNPGNRNQLAGDVFAELLNNRGNTQMTSGMQEIAQGVLGAGGFTPTLNAAGPAILNLLGAGGNTSGQDTLRQIAQSIFGASGLTDTGAVGEGVALEGLLDGGQTDLTRALSAMGINLAGQDNVMSPMQAAAFAANDAMATAKKQYETAYNRAVERGGGPGPTVANGAQAGAMAEFADEISAHRAKALSDTLLSQQGLALQKQGLGSSMALGAGGLDRDRLGTFSSLLGGLEDVASRRFGIGSGMLSGAEELNNARLLGGLNFIPALQNAATSNAGVFGNLGLGAGNLAQGNLDMSGDFMNQLAQLNLGGMGAFGSLLGNQNQYALGGGQLFNQMTQNQGNMFSQLVNNLMSGGNLGMGQTGLLSNILNQNANQNMGLLNFTGGGLQSAFNPLLNLSGSGMDLIRTALSGFPSLAGSFAGNSNPWAPLTSLTPVRKP